MSIVIGCDSFLALRNVSIGQLGRWLAGTDVHVWVDPNKLAGSRVACPLGVHIDRMEEFDPQQDPWLSRFHASIGFARKCYRDPRTIWADFLYSSHRLNEARPWRRAASIGRSACRFGRFWLAGRMGQAEQWRAQFRDRLQDHPVAAVYRNRLAQVGAEVVASFSPEGMREMALIEAANSMKIPTLVMIRSRDNLQHKIPYLPFAAAYAVWSSVAKDCLLELYPDIPPDHVHVTGAPQFDHHVDASHRLDRAELFRHIGLDPGRPLILYSMATPSLIPHESAIVQHLADAAHAGRFANRAQLLVRGHPRMFGSDLRLLPHEYPEARAYPRPTLVRYGGAEHEADMVHAIVADEPVHLSLLAHQDVQVNVCGTMTIDSSIVDKPVVNVFYDQVPNIPEALSVRRFYKRSDTQQMMSYGCSQLAYDGEHCIELINRYLDNPHLDADGRARARGDDCGPLDGEAGRRAARLLLSMRERRRHRLSYAYAAAPGSTVS